MAKARSKASTGDEEWFDAAVTRRVGTWGSVEDAEQALIRELKAGLPYSHVLPDGTRVTGDAEFWSGVLGGQRFILTVDRAKNQATLGPGMSLDTPVSSDVPTKIFGIKVACAVEVGDDLTATAAWVANEARRMKREGKIPPDIRISKFARALATNMRRAAKTDSSIRPVGEGHIKNMLPDWGLWPVARIK